MTDVTDDIAVRLGRYLGEHIPGVGDVDIADVRRIHGGASRETYRCVARWAQDGRDVERRLILRRDPVGSLIETRRDVEFHAYSSFHGTRVPVPEALFLEEDPRWLDRPFFLMEEVSGRAANPFEAEPYGANAGAIGEQVWRILGHVAADERAAADLAGILDRPEPAGCWKRELDYWESVIDADELEPQPIARAAIRWLRRHTPSPPGRVTVVHGDYRSGNFLFEGSKVRAILDWEMCHLGDPLEDLAWAFDPLWAGPAMDVGRPGQLVSRQRAVELWEETSGLEVDPDALTWWEVFAAVKGLAIWISSSKEYATGANKDPVLLFSGWFCTARHDQILCRRMERLLGE